MINCVNLMGRLTDEPVLRTTLTGSEVCSFRIAVNRNHKETDGTTKADFFNCTAWLGTGKTIATYFHKGDMIAVQGRLQSNTYKDKNGNKKFDVEVVVNEFNFCESKGEKR